MQGKTIRQIQARNREVGQTVLDEVRKHMVSEIDEMNAMARKGPGIKVSGKGTRVKISRKKDSVCAEIVNGKIAVTSENDGEDHIHFIINPTWSARSTVIYSVVQGELLSPEKIARRITGLLLF